MAEGAPRKGSFALLLTASMVSSLIMLDSNIVAVSLPTIGQALHAGFTDVQWVISAYVLTYAALLMAAGNFADLHGRKKAMLIGLAIFAAASAACGFATNSALLNAARAVQGVGGAFLLTSSLAIIGHDFSGAERTRAVAFWGAALGIALALGPILGGVITNLVGWRWIFLVNVPLSAGLIWATLQIVKESRDPDAKQLDWGGILTFSGALAVLIWALIDGNDAGWASASILGRLAAAAVLALAFVAVELKQERPMVDFGLFTRKTFLGSVIAMIGYGASAQVMVFFLPLFLQDAYGFSPMMAGVAMLPFALPMVLAPRVTTMLANRYSGRALLTAGLLIALGGNLSFFVAGKLNLPYPVFLVGMVIAGCGAGLLNGQTVKVLQSAVPPARAGMASGLASTTRFIGILVAVAGLGAVLQNTVKQLFVERVSSLGLSQAQALDAAKHVTAGDLAAVLSMVPASARPELKVAGETAFGAGFGQAALLAACVSLVAVVLTYLLVRSEDTAAPRSVPAPKVPCAVVDCRSPL